MKYADPGVELQIIKTICDTEHKSLISKVNKEYFGSSEAIEIYGRLTTLLFYGKELPSTDILKHDQALSESARIFISGSAGALKNAQDISYAYDILEKYRKGRKIFSTLQETLKIMQEQDPKFDKALALLEDAVSSCNNANSKDEMKHYTAANKDKLLEEINRDLKEPVSDAVLTGFTEFDKKSGGFRKKNVIVLASVPGGGKSTMALQLAVNQFMMGHSICFVSYEMDEIELRYRMLACLSKVEHSDINLKKLNTNQIKVINSKFEDWLTSCSHNNRLTIWCPTRELNVPEICQEIKPYNYCAVYIDYLGLLRGDPKKAMWENLGDHTRSAKIQANNLNTALVLLAQFDDQDNKIKYSKAITANANLIWAWEYSDRERESGVVEVKQLKSRNAPLYNFFLNASFKIMTFTECSGPPPDWDKMKEKDKEKEFTKKEIPKMPELKK